MILKKTPTTKDHENNTIIISSLLKRRDNKLSALKTKLQKDKSSSKINKDSQSNTPTN